MLTMDCREFTAADVKRVALLTYRQMNDWEEREVLPHGRATSRGWRRFDPKQLFAVTICAEIRRHLGVPVESLRWLSGQLAADNKYLDAAQFATEDPEDPEDHRSPTLLTDLRTRVEIKPWAVLADSMLARSFDRSLEMPEIILPIAAATDRVSIQIEEARAKWDENAKWI